MDVRRRYMKPTLPSDRLTHRHQEPIKRVKASDALPLPLYLTNGFFFALFFSSAYFLLMRWREKVRIYTPLHVVSFSDLFGIISFVASCIYLLGFFGIEFVQSLRGGEIDDEGDEFIIKEEDSKIGPCGAALDCAIATQQPIGASPKVFEKLSEEDEEIIKAVVNGTTPSYSLESKLGDCKRAVAIRREALQRITGKSLGGLPLDGLDYESILGQCCEMPVGYVQIPVGIAGPLLLDEREYSVPMATTEGCLVASTNRGCKAIYASGGATSVLLKDGMTRAPVVRFGSASRAAELKFFLENPDHFDTLAVVFNKSSRFGRLQGIQCAIAGKNLYMRFTCSTGDAMGNNMLGRTCT